MKKEMRDLIEASSLGTPEAKALREEGKRLLKGEPSVIDEKLDEIAADYTEGRIDEKEAYDRCIEAGCTPAGAGIHVSTWAATGGL
jgi:hypothetical protein